MRLTIPWPGMIGTWGYGNPPSTTGRFVRQTPHAATLTRISPGTGCRTGSDVHNGLAEAVHAARGLQFSSWADGLIDVARSLAWAQAEHKAKRRPFGPAHIQF